MPRPETPAITVDIIVELSGIAERPVILIERKYPPLGWAIPGGFVDVGETVEHAAVREAKEEISLDVKLLSLLGCYSDPARDARGHTVSLVYIAEAEGMPVAADDARNVKVFDTDSLPPQLAFDHGKILADYLRFRNTGKLPPLT